MFLISFSSPHKIALTKHSLKYNKIEVQRSCEREKTIKYRFFKVCHENNELKKRVYERHTATMFSEVQRAERAEISYKIALTKRSLKYKKIEVQRSWQRAWFGTKRPWVQIPPLRPKRPFLTVFFHCFRHNDFSKTIQTVVLVFHDGLSLCLRV